MVVAGLGLLVGFAVPRAMTVTERILTDWKCSGRALRMGRIQSIAIHDLDAHWAVSDHDRID